MTIGGREYVIMIFSITFFFYLKEDNKANLLNF